MDLEVNKNDYRKKIEKKYMNNEQLNPFEQKFMIQTSTILNAHIDKNYIQNAVRMIDKNLIGQLELDIAEEIITKH